MEINGNLFSNAFLNAIDLMIKDRIEKTSITKIIEGKILEAIDEEKNIYKVIYLDSVFNAIATPCTTKGYYKKGMLVYILIPDGSFNKNKIILAPIEDLSI